MLQSSTALLCIEVAFFLSFHLNQTCYNPDVELISSLLCLCTQHIWQHIHSLTYANARCCSSCLCVSFLSLFLEMPSQPQFQQVYLGLDWKCMSNWWISSIFSTSKLITFWKCTQALAWRSSRFRLIQITVHLLYQQVASESCYTRDWRTHT